MENKEGQFNNLDEEKSPVAKIADEQQKQIDDIEWEHGQEAGAEAEKAYEVIIDSRGKEYAQEFRKGKIIYIDKLYEVFFIGIKEGDLIYEDISNHKEHRINPQDYIITKNRQKFFDYLEQLEQKKETEESPAEKIIKKNQKKIDKEYSDEEWKDKKVEKKRVYIITDKRGEECAQEFKRGDYVFFNGVLHSYAFKKLENGKLIFDNGKYKVDPKDIILTKTKEEYDYYIKSQDEVEKIKDSKETIVDYTKDEKIIDIPKEDIKETEKKGLKERAKEMFKGMTFTKAMENNIVNKGGDIIYRTAGSVFGFKGAIDWSLYFAKKGLNKAGIKSLPQEDLPQGDVYKYFSEKDIEKSLIGMTDRAIELKQNAKKGKYQELSKEEKEGMEEYKKYKESKEEMTGAVKEFKKRIREASIPAERKKELRVELLNIMKEHKRSETELHKNQSEKFDQAMRKYTGNKITGFAIGKDALNSALSFTGFSVFRGMAYGAFAALDRGKRAMNKFSRDSFKNGEKWEDAEKFSGEKFKHAAKDIFITSTGETCRELIYGRTEKLTSEQKQEAKQKEKEEKENIKKMKEEGVSFWRRDLHKTIKRAPKHLKRAAAVGIILRGLGIGGIAAQAAMEDGEVWEKPVEELLSRLENMDTTSKLSAVKSGLGEAGSMIKENMFGRNIDRIKGIFDGEKWFHRIDNIKNLFSSGKKNDIPLVQRFKINKESPAQPKGGKTVTEGILDIDEIKKIKLLQSQGIDSEIIKTIEEGGITPQEMQDAQNLQKALDDIFSDNKTSDSRDWSIVSKAHADSSVYDNLSPKEQTEYKEIIQTLSAEEKLEIIKGSKDSDEAKEKLLNYAYSQLNKDGTDMAQEVGAETETEKIYNFTDNRGVELKFKKGDKFYFDDLKKEHIFRGLDQDGNIILDGGLDSVSPKYFKITEIINNNESEVNTLDKIDGGDGVLDTNKEINNYISSELKRYNLSGDFENYDQNEMLKLAIACRAEGNEKQWEEIKDFLGTEVDRIKSPKSGASFKFALEADELFKSSKEADMTKIIGLGRDLKINNDKIAGLFSTEKQGDARELLKTTEEIGKSKTDEPTKEKQPIKKVKKPIGYQGGEHIWGSVEKFLTAKYGDDFAKLGGDNKIQAEALKTYNIDEMKDEIVRIIEKGTDAEKKEFGLDKINDPDKIIAAKLEKINYDEIAKKVFFKEEDNTTGLTEELSDQDAKNIVGNNEKLKQFFIKNQNASRSSANYEEILNPTKIASETEITETTGGETETVGTETFAKYNLEERNEYLEKLNSRQRELAGLITQAKEGGLAEKLRSERSEIASRITGMNNEHYKLLIDELKSKGINDPAARRIFTLTEKGRDDDLFEFLTENLDSRHANFLIENIPEQRQKDVFDLIQQGKILVETAIDKPKITAIFSEMNVSQYNTGDYNKIIDTMDIKMSDKNILLFGKILTGEYSEKNMQRFFGVESGKIQFNADDGKIILEGANGKTIFIDIYNQKIGINRLFGNFIRPLDEDGLKSVKKKLL